MVLFLKLINTIITMINKIIRSKIRYKIARIIKNYFIKLDDSSILKKKIYIVFYFYKNFSPKRIKNTLKSIKFYSSFIKKGDLCFDIGANIGDYALKFLLLGAKVICVEPEEKNLKKLSLRYSINKSVSIVPMALSDTEGDSELFVCTNATTISTLSEKWKNDGRFSNNYTWDFIQKVQTTTLDKLIKIYGLPKFCKIDVEGFEYNVLKGLSRKIPYISFEITREFFDNAIKCINYLIELGYVKFNFFYSKIQDLYFSSWVNKSVLIDAITNIDDDLLGGDIFSF